MRILVAEDDDVAAFVLQCELNKLDEPFSFQRASNAAEYLQQLRDFSPTLVIASYRLISPPLIVETRQRVPGARLIVIGADGDAAAAEEALQLGATDCLFTSKLSEIRLCLKQKSRSMCGRDQTVATRHTLRNHKYFMATRDWFREAWRETCEGWTMAANSAPGRITARWSGQVSKALQRRWRRLMAFCTGAHAMLELRSNRASSSQAGHTVGFSAANPGRSGSPAGTVGEPANLVSTNGNGSHPPTVPRHDNSSGEEISSRFSPLSEDPLPTFQVQALQRELYQEIIAREEAEDALKASEISFKTLFESSLDAAFLLDSEGAILQANSAACVLLGLPLSELSNRHLREFIPDGRDILFDSEWKGFVDQGFWRGEKVFRAFGGRLRDTQFSATSNVWCGVHLFIARDITERKRLSLELEEIRKALSKSLEAQAIQRRLLNELEQKLSSFAAGAARLGHHHLSGEAFG